MIVHGSCKIEIKIKEVTLNLSKDSHSINDIHSAIQKVNQIPVKIGSIIDKLYVDGYILWKRDCSVIRKYLIDKEIFPKLTYESMSRIISKYSNLPDNKTPSADNMADVIIRGQYPDWRIDSCNDPEEELRLKEIAIRFDILWNGCQFE